MTVLIADVQAEVCRHFAVDPLDLISDRQSIEIARPRQIAMYLARHLTTRSLPEIGRKFSRDHTTVLYSVRRIEELRWRDTVIRAHVRAILKAVSERVQRRDELYADTAQIQSYHGA